jgi:hypothetical protein|tara:strand:- start:10565 stop:10753 length:189 start_codon:yes stop_codon:yes gene_type:complete
VCGGGRSPAPAPPPAPVKAPASPLIRSQYDGSKKRKRTAGILTSAEGVLGTAPVNKKTLLGG